MTARVADWENRLAETIALWSGRPFKWSRDCGRWAAACVIATTGVDPIDDLRSEYRTKREALKVLAKKPMVERLDDLFPRVHPAFAMRGDIALTQDNCLGCVIGSEALFYFEGGMTPIPKAEWQGVWGVGHG